MLDSIFTILNSLVEIAFSLGREMLNKGNKILYCLQNMIIVKAGEESGMGNKSFEEISGGLIFQLYMARNPSLTEKVTLNKALEEEV